MLEGLVFQALGVFRGLGVEGFRVKALNPVKA